MAKKKEIPADDVPVETFTVGAKIPFERAVQAQAETLDDFGREELDPTPMAPPIGYVKQPSMVDHIRQMIASERLRQEAEAEGFESFEEANDFDVEDNEPRSVYETDLEVTDAEIRARYPQFFEHEAPQQPQTPPQGQTPPAGTTPPAPSPAAPPAPPPAAQ